MACLTIENGSAMRTGHAWGFAVLVLTLVLGGPSGVLAQTKEVGDFFNVVSPEKADPWVFRHSDGLYYWVYSTGGHVELLRSPTLSGLGAGERKVVWTPEKAGPASRDIWAPELHRIRGKWYIYVAADDGENKHHRMYVLENGGADPFAGSFTFKGRLSVPGEDRWAIDGTALEVGDRLYFVWSGWEGFENVRQNLYIAPMGDPWTISGERVMISTPDQEWEARGGRPAINEGPEAIVRDGRVLLVYSASGSWSDFYCLGLLSAKVGADLMDAKSWTKHAGPVFASANGVKAPGHASFTKSRDGKEDWIVYHTARFPGAGWTRLVRAQRFRWTAEGLPDFGSPVPADRRTALPGGEGPRWRVEAESGRFSGPVRVSDRPEASGGKKVGFLDAAESVLELTLEVPKAGGYGMAVRYGNGTEGGEVATQRVSVNGGKAETVRYPFTRWDHWSNAFARVSLKKGKNILRFTRGEGAVEIDCVDVWEYVPAK
jgi:GH43 family beta-xylosidase